MPFASSGDRIVFAGTQSRDRDFIGTAIFQSHPAKPLEVIESPGGMKHIAAVTLSPDGIYLGGLHGIFVRKDVGSEWKPIPGFGSEQVVGLEWIRGKLWIATPDRVMEHDGREIVRTFESGRDFGGHRVGGLIDLAENILVATYLRPPEPGEKCSESTKLEYPSGAYLIDSGGRRVRRVNPGGVFGLSESPRLLYDIFPSTTPGTWIVQYGEGDDDYYIRHSIFAAKDIGLESSGSEFPADPRRYNPFLSIIAKAGTRAATARQNIESFLLKIPDNKIIGRKAWYAEFELLAQRGEWDEIATRSRSFPKRLWAMRFLSEASSDKTNKPLQDLASRISGRDTDSVTQLEDLPNSRGVELLQKIRDGKLVLLSDESARQTAGRILESKKRDSTQIKTKP